MTLIERKRYVIIVSVAFLIGCVMFSVLMSFGYVSFKNPGVEISLYRMVMNTIQTGMLGGYCLGSLVSGGVWFIYFIKRKPMWFKIFAIVLFFMFIKKILLVSFLLASLVYLYNLLRVLKKQLVDEG